MRWKRAALVVPSVLLALLAGISAVGELVIEARQPPVGQFIEVDGIRLHYTDQGAGPAIVLLHGASSNLLEFQHSLAPRLASSHRVLVFDRPGHGYSERPDREWMHPGEIARLVLDACEALGAPRPLIVGHSWAGSIVMSALVREPARVAGGVLIAGVAGHWVPSRDLTDRLAQWPWLNAVFAHTALYPLGRFLMPGAIESVFAPQPVPEGHEEVVGATLALRSDSYLQNARDLHLLSRYLQFESTRYDEITTPLLAIHGTRDELVPFWNHAERLMHVIAGMEVALIDGAGHALHHVAPDRISALIKAFDARHRRAD